MTGGGRMMCSKYEGEAYTAEIDPCDPDMLCDGCGCDPRPFKELIPIEHAVLTPGDPSPAGRCPECDGLVYPMEPEELQ